MSQTLWAGLHCAELPLAAVWRLAEVNGPIAVHASGQGQPRILQACARARAAGVHPGQHLAQALAVLPHLHSRQRDPGAEAVALEQMALSAYGHSHQVVLAPPDTVLLEVGGSRRLRGGIRPLLETLRAELAEAGLALRIGSGPVPAAARLLARLEQSATDLAGLRRCLAGLAPEQLELNPEQCRLLRACGLARVGDLLKLPVAERSRRFGQELERYLANIEGRQATPLNRWQPPMQFRQRLELPVASARTEALLFVLRRMIGQLGHWLRVRDRALTRLRLALEREDGGAPTHLSVGLSQPGFDAERLLNLLRLKLEDLRLGAPIDALRIDADSTSAHRPPQRDLFSGHNQSDAWPALLDRLGARLGEDGLAGLAACADHRPEKAWRWVTPGTTSNCQEKRARPSWLLAHPRPCRADDFKLEDGPERIETGWWDGQDCRRDYWVARDRDGRRLWVFREYKPRDGWFLHGLFG